MKINNIIPPEPSYQLPFFQTWMGQFIIWVLIAFGILAAIIFMIIFIRKKQKEKKEEEK